MALIFTCSLQQISLFAVAGTIWQQNKVRKKVIGVFLRLDKMGSMKEWRKLTQDVIENLSALQLPCFLEEELSYAVKDAASRIYDYFLYLRNINFFDNVFTEEMFDKILKDVCWTSIGTIDKAKTLETMWLNNPDVDVFKFFLMASSVCCEDLVSTMWEKLPENVQTADYSGFYGKQSLHVIIYWIWKNKSCSENLYNKIKGYYDSHSVAPFHNEKNSLEYNFVSFMIYNKNYSAAKYFWQKLSMQEKKKKAPSVFIRAVGYLMFWSSNVRQYKIDQCLELCILLFNSMLKDGKTYLVLKEPGILFLRLLVSAYPWQEFVVPALRKVQNNFDLYYFNAFFCCIGNSIMHDFYDFNLCNSIIQKQIPSIWKTLPSNFKYPTRDKMLPVLYSKNFKNAQFILEHEDIVEKREKLLRHSYEVLMDWILDEEWEAIEKFVEKLLILRKWENDVQETVKEMYRIIMFDLKVKPAKMFLDSKYDSEESKNILLQKLNHEILCYYLIRRDHFHVLNDYCEWIYPVKEELITFKHSFQFKKYTLDFIYDIWSSSTDDWRQGEQLATKFLDWIFDNSESDILRFKKEIILNDFKKMNWKTITSTFYSSNSFELLPNFLSWCSLSANDIKKIIDQDAAYLWSKKCQKYVQQNKMQKMEKLLNVFSCKNEENKFKSEFILSAEGLKSLRFFIGTAKTVELDPELKRQELTEKFKNFIDVWLIQSLDLILKIERHLSEFCESKLNSVNQTDDDHGSVNNMNLDFDERETVILNFDPTFDYESDPNLKAIIWDEKNFCLFLNLLFEARVKYIKSVKIK